MHSSRTGSSENRSAPNAAGDGDAARNRRGDSRFRPNYDGRVQEPTVLPSRFPNLLANGSGGIAVGMATNMPPHNLRELGEAVFWCLENFEADEETTLEAVSRTREGSRTSLPTDSSSDRRASPTRTGPAEGRFGCAVSGDRRGQPGTHRDRHHRTAVPGPTTTTSSPRSPSRFATPNWRASRTSRISPVTGSGCASSSN